ncbi:MAG TPA: DegT/DnrJ/EryC1/StrS family aminotransferase [Jatrophihabitans sp.]|jgi:dTDP-4-amino-4,6-dideoxygalactose transaminase
MIPISTVQIGEEEQKLVLEVLRSGHLAQGPRVAELEQRFAELVGVRHAVAVNNGTTSLVASLQALQLQPGDEVITSPFTFVATLNAILEAGATVRFADIGDDFNLDPEQVRSRISRRSKVLMPVHLYGLPADMPALMQIAQEHELAIVEDAAQAHGARVAGRGAGSFGLGSFSFYATKNVTTGEGGIITTDDDRLADSLRLLRNQGMRARYQYEIAGHNYRMTDLQAALAIPQLDRLADSTARRRMNADRLISGLSGIEGLLLPAVPEGREHVWHQFTVRVTDSAKIGRDELAAALTQRGVGSGIYYPRLVHDYACYRDNPQVIDEPTPAAARVVTEVVSLPVHPALSDPDLDQIIAAVRSVLT